METYTGKHINPLFINEDDIDIIDIARSLSMTCRFGGHVETYFSVANHCVNMANWFLKRGREEEALWALIHETDEIVFGDLPTPVKYLPEMDAYRRLCKNVTRVGFAKFGLYGKPPKSIKELDTRMVYAEARVVKPKSALARMNIDVSDIEIEVYTQKKAEKEFLKLYKKLRRDGR
jgi:5'-deoxynucleotidase YfbR-like HD superfamily hydrolase